jgi:protein O-mannosyl-transferase
MDLPSPQSSVLSPQSSPFPALASAALALALYVVTVGGTYIYDDVQIIEKDTRIQSPAQWKQLWTKDYFNGGIDNLYRPLTSQTFAIQWWLHGDRPWAFHLVNVLLHAAAAAAVAELARRLAGTSAAYVAGLFFAAHPIHVEAVAGIVGRAEELCTLFTIGGLAMFLRRPLTRGRAVAVALCGIAAMLSKEQGMLFPFLLLTLALCTGRRSPSAEEKRAFQVLILLLCWSTAGLIVLREQVLNLRFEWDKVFLDVSIQPLKSSGPSDRALMVFVILGHYAQLLVAPVKLSIDYGLSVLNGVADRRDPYLYVGMAMAAAGAAAMVWTVLRRQWPAAFCLIAAALTYSMASNVILIGTIFAERLVYLPSAFLLIWAAIYLARLRPIPLRCIVTTLLVLAGFRTVTYAARWNDRYDFYTTSLAEQPKSARLHELLVTEMMSRGDLSGAARVAADGRRVTPQYWNLWVLSGEVAERQGDLQAADALYHKAFELQPLVGLQVEIQKLDAEIAAERHGR